MYVVTVNFRIKMPHVASFRAAVVQQAKNSLEREANCTRFDVFVSPDDERAVFLFEEYTDRAAFDAHSKTEHFREFSSAVSSWVDEKQVTGWEPLEK
jgi:quinol monooxygenase YgiN